MAVSPLVLIRCDGTPEIGMGHVVRCLALAEELKDAHGYEVRFLLRERSIGSLQITAHGFLVNHAPEDTLEAEWIDKQLKVQRPDVLIFDSRTGLGRDVVKCWQQSGLLVVSIDDPEEKRLAADLVFYPPVPQVERMNWQGFVGERHVGWDWVILRSQFSSYKLLNVTTNKSKADHIPQILVTMGGSDPAGLTMLALEALEKIDQPFHATVLIGAGFCHTTTLNEWLKTATKKYEVLLNVDDVAAIMAGSDLAIASFGMTAYELAAMGVPALYVCLSEDHAESAGVFTDAGIGISLGVSSRVTVEMLAGRIGGLLGDPYARQKQSEVAKDTIDGLGAIRIAEKIASKGLKK